MTWTYQPSPHQVRMFKAFAHAEGDTLEARVAAAAWPIRWLYGHVAATVSAIRIVLYGRRLGLTIDAMRKIMESGEIVQPEVG